MNDTPTTAVSVAVMYFDANGKFTRSEVMPSVMPHEYQPMIRAIEGNAVVLPSHYFSPQMLQAQTQQLELDLWN